MLVLVLAVEVLEVCPPLYRRRADARISREDEEEGGENEEDEEKDDVVSTRCGSPILWCWPNERDKKCYLVRQGSLRRNVLL